MDDRIGSAHVAIVSVWVWLTFSLSAVVTASLIRGHLCDVR